MSFSLTCAFSIGFIASFKRGVNSVASPRLCLVVASPVALLCQRPTMVGDNTARGCHHTTNLLAVAIMEVIPPLRVRGRNACFGPCHRGTGVSRKQTTQSAPRYSGTLASWGGDFDKTGVPSQHDWLETTKKSVPTRVARKGWCQLGTKFSPDQSSPSVHLMLSLPSHPRATISFCLGGLCQNHFSSTPPH